MKDPSILWDFKNGYVVYGGIIGGILASYIYCRTKKQAFMPYFDLGDAGGFVCTRLRPLWLLCGLLLRQGDGCVVRNHVS